MAGLNDDAQWIVLMGFIVSFSLFFLAIILNQSVVVGQTTAEAVSEFPKQDIRGVRDVIIQSAFMDDNDGTYKNLYQCAGRHQDTLFGQAGSDCGFLIKLQCRIHVYRVSLQ